MMFAGASGRCAAQTGAVDWSLTPLGPADKWSPALKTTVGNVLRSVAPKAVLWGPELLSLYNDAFCGLIPGATPDKIGLPFAKVIPAAWSDCWSRVAQSLNRNEGIETEVEAHFGDGEDRSVRYLHVYSTPVFEDEAPAGVLIDLRDVTAPRLSSQLLKRENHRLQQLFYEAPVLLAYFVGPDLRLEVVNRAFQTFFGDRALAHRPLIEAIPEHVEHGFDTVMADALRTGKPWIGECVPVRIRNGDSGEFQMRYVDLIFQPVSDGGMPWTGILCVGSDVTDRMTAEQERERLKHQLLHASRVNAMGTMAMTLAHELNQPLAAAANYLAAARRLVIINGVDRDSDLVEAVSRAQGQVTRTGEVIRRMRSIVRAGEASLQSVSVEAVLDRVIQLLETGNSLRLAVTKQIGERAAHVMADEIQLEQVLINLLRNALQASAASSRKEVIVRTERLDENWVRISLRDFGRGIAPEQAASIFDGLQPSESEGLGVGLSLSRTLIESNGGEIKARNAEGGGAIFEIRLTAAPEPLDGRESAALMLSGES